MSSEENTPANRTKSSPPKGSPQSSDGVVVKRRWSSAVHHVMEAERRRMRSTEADASDQFGIALAAQMNQHPLFRQPTRDDAADEDEPRPRPSFRWMPLVSRHNWSVLRRNLSRGWRDTTTETDSWSGISVTCWRKGAAFAGYLVNEHRPSFSSVLLFFVRLLILMMIVVAVVEHFVVVLAAQAAWSLFSHLFLFLVDWEDLRKHCYTPFVQPIVRKVRRVALWIDSWIFLGRRYVGREWNQDDFEWNDPLRAESRRATLWELPPPCIDSLGRSQCLDKDWLHHENKQWSSQTVHHMAAVNYCYLMLQEESLRKKKKKRRQKILDRTMSLPHQEEALAVDERRIISDDSDDEKKEEGMVDHRALLERTVGASNDRAILWSHSLDSPHDAIELKTSESKVHEQKPSYTRRLSQNSDDVFSSGDEFSVKSVVSDVSDAAAADLPWIDVGAKIGMRLLSSEHVQRAMASQDTTDRIMGSVGKLGSEAGTPSKTDSARMLDLSSERNKTTPVTEKKGSLLSKPTHSMWTSPEAAGSALFASAANLSDNEDANSVPDISRSQSFPASPVSQRSLPPVSPRSLRPSMSPRNRFGQRGSSPRDRPSRPVGSPAKLPPPPPFEHQQMSPPEIQRKFMPRVLRKEAKVRQSENGEAVRNGTPGIRKQTSLHRPVGRAGTIYRRAPLQPGIRVAVPLFPRQPGKVGIKMRTIYQMATVVSSKRIYVGTNEGPDSLEESNCLSVTVKLEHFFLRHGEFAELTFRVMDSWSPRYMPRHSKVPIGSCVATSFGIGVLVGWRVEDDCHVVRSLWQRRGPGTAHAYLNRQAIHDTIEAAVGFRIQTTYGWGVVLGCVKGNNTFEACRFLVEIQEEGRRKGSVLEVTRKDVLTCPGAKFLPIIEHVREAANYQIQVDNYEAALRRQRFDDSGLSPEQEWLQRWSSWLDILWKSFLKAVEEDKDFDDEVNNFMSSIIDFLDRLDQTKCDSDEYCEVIPDEIEVQLAPQKGNGTDEPSFLILNDLFGGVFGADDTGNEALVKRSPIRVKGGGDREKPSNYDRAFGVLRTLMKTVSIARVASVDHPHLRLGLAIVYDFLLFLRTVVKVQQKNTSEQSLAVWERAWEEIVATFGPIRQRIENIGRGIAQRMEAHGRKAKIRLLKFVDKFLGDEMLLGAMEQGEWDRCFARLEFALVEAEIIQQDNLVHYRKAAKFVYDHIQLALTNEGDAAARNAEKLALVAMMIQSFASPRRSLLKIFRRDDVLELFERILVRAYSKENLATRMLTIHATNFHSLRHLRMLKDFSIAGSLWIPLFDAADEEFSWLVSHLPDNSKEFMCPLSSLFSLCVAQFHKINAGDLSKDWLEFLLEEDSMQIIHDIDMKLILALESFSRDVREMMMVLPYYPSIDDDILNLMDEVDLDEFVKEASDAIEDSEKLSQFVREKATICIERFLNYLPKMSIPVERRDLGDGWVLTCHGQDGGGLTLSDVNIKRRNLVCQILGGDSLFFPMFADDDADSMSSTSPSFAVAPTTEVSHSHLDESILVHIRDLILNAQEYGCWKEGVGGIGQAPSNRYIASVLQGLPVSSILNRALQLWRNLELDDDELLEIAVRDVSYQIQLQKDRDDGFAVSDSNSSSTEALSPASVFRARTEAKLDRLSSFESDDHRFNPRLDPTILFLEIKKLTLNLDNFSFRIEKDETKTIFDPVFEGRGMVSLRNISIRLRVEVAKERVKKTDFDAEISSPILQLRELEVKIENVTMTIHDTGFGSDWIVNRAVEVFQTDITNVVQENLKEQIHSQIKNAIDSLNSYSVVNPNLLLSLLGISMDDLDENVVWV